MTADAMFTHADVCDAIRGLLHLADDGTLLALDASLRGPHGQAEVRFRTGSSIAIANASNARACSGAERGPKIGAVIISAPMRARTSVNVPSWWTRNGSRMAAFNVYLGGIRL